ncbi:MAG: TRAP transporter substrate-binding protein DctP [Thermodesulfobacteriota bacterium]|nr:TRAP transporter substrate-binding protein DctP [Thermodesulfobacteriota bacterium]
MELRKKRIVLLFNYLFLVLLFFGIGLPEAVAKKSTHIWKVASHAPKGVGWAVYLDKMNPDIKRITNGEVYFDWYHGGVMGDDEDYIAKIQIDQLQGAGFDGHGIVMICPETAVFQLPFLFNSFDEVAYVKAELKERLSELFSKNGYKLLVSLDQSFDDFYSTKREIRTPEDFVKSKFVTYSGQVDYEVLKSLGASPIPLNVPEIASSFRSRLCDAVLAPSIWWVGAQLYTITKHVTSTNIRYAPGAVAISMKAWNRVPEEYHRSILEIMPEHERGFNQYSQESGEKCLQAMIKYGIKEVKLTHDEVKMIKKRTKPVWDKLAGGLYPRELLDQIMGLLNQYRSQTASN